jgi:endogenous inhibitor of DNA gyrase (YacG/DUF329 family)
MASFTVVLEGTREQVKEKAAVIQQALNGIDSGMAGEPSKFVPRDWCPTCETPYHWSINDPARAPRKCDICGTPIER